MKKLNLVVLAVLAVVGCGKDRIGSDVPQQNQEVAAAVEHGAIVLGDRLENPYTVENMTKALVSLYPTKSSGVRISATDLYVRFLPADDAQLTLLESMGLEMIDHPVDYRIVKEGDWYHDPSIPEDRITWQYAVVDQDFKFPAGIRYEIIDDVFLSEDKVATRACDGIDWDAVEKESFRLTGNSSLFPETKAGGDGCPEGRIAILDEAYDSEPLGVAGVKVSCNVFVKFGSAYTDDEGYYKISKSFSRNPRYRLVFKNKMGFGIGFNLLIIPASFSTLGTKSPEGVSTVIDKTCDRPLFSRCVVNNAGYDYFSKCKEFGIKQPPSNLRIWLFQHIGISTGVMMQQGAGIDNTLVGDLLGQYSSILKMFLPDITLGLRDCDDYPSIYGEAMHQLAHSSHYVQVGNDYWLSLMTYVVRSFITSGFIVYGTGSGDDRGYCEVGEMWAYYMQTKMYRDRYPDSAASFGTNYWFCPQVLYYLDQRGMGPGKIFKALASDVTDRDKLKARLISLYPESKTMITQAFDRYE